jgi:hypothetical protein
VLNELVDILFRLSTIFKAAIEKLLVTGEKTVEREVSSVVSEA